MVIDSEVEFESVSVSATSSLSDSRTDARKNAAI